MVTGMFLTLATSCRITVAAAPAASLLNNMTECVSNIYHSDFTSGKPIIKMKGFKIIVFLLMLLTSRQMHAQISANPTSGCAPLVGVTFTSPLGATNIDWQFGDGSTSNLPSPTHTFTLPGTYLVQFTAIVGGSNVNYSLTINVHGKPSPKAHSLKVIAVPPPPKDESRNITVSGTQPMTGVVALKLGDGFP